MQASILVGTCTSSMKRNRIPVMITSCDSKLALALSKLMCAMCLMMELVAKTYHFAGTLILTVFQWQRIPHQQLIISVCQAAPHSWWGAVVSTVSNAGNH